MSALPIRFANIVIGPNGNLIVAVPDAAGLRTDMQLEIQLRIDMSFDVFQGLSHVGHVESTPPEVMAALATASRVVLIEVGDDGPVRTHDRVQVHNSV
jgi:hypothetical protein